MAFIFKAHSFPCHSCEGRNPAPPLSAMLKSTMSDQEATSDSDEGENKKERVDELDIIGGILVILVRKAFNKIKQFFQPPKVQ